MYSRRSVNCAARRIRPPAYVKDPTDPQWENDEETKVYKSWLREYFLEGKEGDINIVIGYVAAETMEHVLRAAGSDLSRENIMKIATNLRNVRVPMLYPGISLNTSPGDYGTIH